MYVNLKKMQLKKFKTCVHQPINLHIQNICPIQFDAQLPMEKVSIHMQVPFFNHDVSAQIPANSDQK